VRLDVVMWPDAAWPVLRDEWLRAEDLGVRRGWLYDHLLLNGRAVWHDAFITLAAVAAATTSIGLGTMVTSPNFRHPVTTAKAAQALSELSDGRFILGVGAGVARSRLGRSRWSAIEPG
jgi:alkanesulfonate monooxygenase SsuD/methylene tetrahydromethanopterin reductase-like flavin-dependent oxidoreductase (luciferase family)